MELKAVVEPRLTSDMRMAMVSENRTELSGISVPMTVMRAQVALAGRPSSRAKAKTWRDAAARPLMQVHMVRTMTTMDMSVAPVVLPVAEWKTSTKGKATGRERRVGRSVMQKQKVMIMMKPWLDCEMV